MGIQWVYNGSTMGLQWVYKGSTMGLQWVYNMYTICLQCVYNDCCLQGPSRFSPLDLGPGVGGLP
eukprot:4200308-Heterocapsa_arctica.AAC.1